MKEDEYTDDMNQLLEIINAKGDTGELLEIVDKYKQPENPECNHDLFYQELRVIAEDSAKED
ncbi:hypothetical protein [Gottfriedia luciferensis]|uniref:hypothetical protein n=1 Tax=Gottfriedia luciferensis TaxID=178774 RepID=UPI000B43BC92|nr:hypothetical protein [Gottfriedia luciferensis]